MIKKESNKIKSDKGITLITLLVTVILMVILLGITVDNGLKTLYSTQLKGFYAQLEIVQKKVDEIASTRDDYNNLGNDLDPAQETKLNNILSLEGPDLGLSYLSFRYFTITNLKDEWGLSGIEYNVFVNFESRTVIAEEGKKINGKTYYILNNQTYYVNQDTNKDEEFTVNELEFESVSYGKEYYPNIENGTIIYKEKDKYKVTVIPINKKGNRMSGGTLNYKKTDNEQWDISDNLEFVVEISTINKSEYYDIKYIDNNNNRIDDMVIEVTPEGRIFIYYS